MTNEFDLNSQLEFPSQKRPLYQNSLTQNPSKTSFQLNNDISTDFTMNFGNLSRTQKESLSFNFQEIENPFWLSETTSTTKKEILNEDLDEMNKFEDSGNISSFMNQMQPIDKTSKIIEEKKETNLVTQSPHKNGNLQYPSISKGTFSRITNYSGTTFDNSGSINNPHSRQLALGKIKEIKENQLKIIEQVNQQKENLSNHLHSLNKNYIPLEDGKLPKNPMQQFQLWFEDANADSSIINPEAMTLSTCSKQGFPSSRMVLLKSFDDRGFVFFSNYRSKKSIQLEENPRAALVFYWATLNRSIRVEGEVEKVATSESDQYFAIRPRESQIGAWVSAYQSSTLTWYVFFLKKISIFF